MNRLSDFVTARALEKAYVRSDSVATARLLLNAAYRGCGNVFSLLTDHPLHDDWRDFASQALSDWVSRRRGFIYVVGNAAQGGFYKVGQTSRNPIARLAELNNEAVIGRFELVHSWAVWDRFTCEKRAHQALSGVPVHKEFFHMAWQPLLERVEQSLVRDKQLMARAGLLHWVESSP